MTGIRTEVLYARIIYLPEAPWFVCRLCGFDYSTRLSSDIMEQALGDEELMAFTKRLVKKSIVMHVCSHLIGERLFFPELGWDSNPVELGQEYYLRAPFRWFRGLDVFALYGIREDARDQSYLVWEQYKNHLLNESEYPSLSTSYDHVIRRCGVLASNYIRINGLARNPCPIPGEDTKRDHRTNLPVRRAYLKPWKDPESLFCDTEFLTQLLGKEPRKGDECRDDDER